MLEKTKGANKNGQLKKPNRNGQSRDTGNIGHLEQIEDIQNNIHNKENCQNEQYEHIKLIYGYFCLRKPTYSVT